MKSVFVWTPLRVARLLLCLIGLTALASASTYEIFLSSQNDGNSFRARFGTSDTWNDYAFEGSANPVRAQHYFSSGWGEIRNAFLQIPLAAILAYAPEDLVSAQLRLYITDVGGSGSSLHHRTNSSSATGDASQQLTGDVLVTSLSSASAGGWQIIDITDVIRNDLAAGHSWAVFSLPATSNSLLSFAGSGDATNAPSMIVQIPEPRTVGLLLAGGCLLFAVWKSRRRRG